MITTAQVAVALGRPEPQVDTAERLQWNMWIQKARLLVSAGPNGTGDIDLDGLNQDRLDSVILDAVVAHVRRPDDATQVDTSIDDGRVSKIYKSSAGEIVIRPKDWSFLGLAPVASGAFSVRPSFTPDGPCW